MKMQPRAYLDASLGMRTKNSLGSEDGRSNYARRVDLSAIGLRKVLACTNEGRTDEVTHMVNDPIRMICRRVTDQGLKARGAGTSG